MTAIKTTIRLSPDLNEELETYAKQEYLSKNKVVKKALRKLFKRNRTQERGIKNDKFTSH